MQFVFTVIPPFFFLREKRGLLIHGFLISIVFLDIMILFSFVFLLLASSIYVDTFLRFKYLPIIYKFISTLLVFYQFIIIITYHKILFFILLIDLLSQSTSQSCSLPQLDGWEEETPDLRFINQ